MREETVNECVRVLSDYIRQNPLWKIESSHSNDESEIRASCYVKGKTIAIGFKTKVAGRPLPEVDAEFERSYDALNLGMAQACALTWLGIDCDA